MAGLRDFCHVTLLGLLLVRGASAEGYFTDRDVERRVSRGNELYRDKKFDEAIKEYTEAQSRRPGTPEILRNLADAYFEKGEFQKAYSHYERAAGVTGRVPEDAYGMGNAAFRMEKYDEAAKLYKEALTRKSDFDQAKRNLELSLLRLDEKKKQDPDKKDPKKDPKQDGNQAPKNPPSPSPGAGSSPSPSPGEPSPSPGSPSPSPAAPSPSPGASPSPAPSPSPAAPEPSPSPASAPGPSPAAPAGASPDQEKKDREKADLAEVQRILESMKDEEKRVLKDVMRRMVPESPAPVENDW